MTGQRLPDMVAAKIERKDGLPCGGCGGHHVESMKELESSEHPCTCRCCHGALVEMVEAHFPDLVTTCEGARVVSAAAFAEMIRRLEAEIASMSV